MTSAFLISLSILFQYFLFEHKKFDHLVQDLLIRAISVLNLPIQIFYPIWPGLFFGCLGQEVGGRGGGGGKCLRPITPKTIHGIKIKFGRVVENHKLINLM